MYTISQKYLGLGEGRGGKKKYFGVRFMMYKTMEWFRKKKKLRETEHTCD